MNLAENPAKAAHLAIKQRLRARIWRLKDCEWCGKEFDPQESGHRDYCSDECSENSTDMFKSAQRDAVKDKYHNAKRALLSKKCHCGVEYQTYKQQQMYCSETCKRKINDKRRAERGRSK